MRLYNRQAQNIIEYIVLFAIVLLIFIVFLRPGGRFHKIVNEVVESPVNQLEQVVQDITVP